MPFCRFFHTTTQLVQIAQTETVGVIDDYRIHIRNIHSALDNRSCHQDIEIVIDKVHNGLLQLDRFHLSVRNRNTCIRAQTHKHTLHRHQILHTVVYKIDLTVTRQLRLDNLLHKFLREGMRLCLDRSAIWRRG